MDEREAEYLRQCIRDLQQSNRRWKMATFSLLVLLTVLMIPGALAVVGLAGREARMQAERAQMEALEAHRQAERAVQQARQAEQAARLPQPLQADAAGGGGTDGVKGTQAQPLPRTPGKAVGEETRKTGAGGPSSPGGEKVP